jgi:hypothetical protein
MRLLNRTLLASLVGTVLALGCGDSATKQPPRQGVDTPTKSQEEGGTGPKKVTPKLPEPKDPPALPN